MGQARAQVVAPPVSDVVGPAVRLRRRAVLTAVGIALGLGLTACQAEDKTPASVSTPSPTATTAVPPLVPAPATTTAKPSPAPSPKPSPTAVRRTASPKPRVTRAATKAPQPTTDPQFGTCTEAKAHGYGPYYQGTDPEYDWYQDRDHDGIVCE